MLGGAVHPHSLDHHRGNAHLRGRDDAHSDALHALFSIGAARAAANEALTHQRIQMNGLEGNVILGSALQIALLNPLVVQRIGVHGTTAVRKLYPRKSGLVGHLNGLRAPIRKTKLTNAKLDLSHDAYLFSSIYSKFYTIPAKLYNSNPF